MTFFMLSFLFGVMGAAFMAHGAVFALGAYGMFYLNVVYGIPALVAILISGLGAALLGSVVEFVVHRRLWHDADLALVAYVGLLWAVLLGYFVWGTLPNAMGWCGIALLIGAGLYMVRQQRRAS